MPELTAPILVRNKVARIARFRMILWTSRPSTDNGHDTPPQFQDNSLPTNKSNLLIIRHI